LIVFVAIFLKRTAAKLLIYSIIVGISKLIFIDNRDNLPPIVR